MTASIVGLRSSKDKRLAFVIASLISLAGWYIPTAGTAYAKTEDSTSTSIVFEIKTPDSLESATSATLLTMAQLEQEQAAEVQQAQTDEEVADVRAYLQSKKSPLAQYTEILLAQPHWKTIIAVSNSESTLGQHCYVNNCSGIFGPDGLRTYKSVPDWIVDMEQLLEQHYANMTLDQMDGIYVQPRSTNWYLASSSVYSDLNAIEQKVDADTATGTPSTALQNSLVAMNAQ